MEEHFLRTLSNAVRLQGPEEAPEFAESSQFLSPARFVLLGAKEGIDLNRSSSPFHGTLSRCLLLTRLEVLLQCHNRGKQLG